MRTLVLFCFCLNSAVAQYQPVLLDEAPGTDGNVTVGNGIGGGQQVGNNYANPFPWPSIIHAHLWTGSSASVVDLNPAFCGESEAFAAADGFQVGQCGGRAILWSGTAASAVDLTPANYTTVTALGVSQGQQVGVGYLTGGNGNPRALLWTGTAASVVDLTPAAFLGAQAMGVHAGHQAGFGMVSTGINHALVWNGTAADYVDLHPAGFDGSQANGVHGNQQVGYVYGAAINGYTHATLWNGSADTMVDLHPSGWEWSYANGTNGVRQVGEAYTTAGSHAMVWTGSAATAIDLHNFLPPGAVSSSASAIDDAGNIIGSATFYSTNGGPTYAVLWQATGIYPPVTTATRTPAANSYGWTRSPVTVSLASVPGTPGTSVTRITYQIDAQPQVLVQGDTASFTVSAQGAHTVAYFAADSEGNVEVTHTLPVNIDRTPPATTASAACLQVTLAAADSLSGVAATYYKVDGGATRVYGGPFTLTATRQHSVEFWSMDKAGNSEGHQTTTVNPATYAPSLSSLAPSTVHSGNGFRLTVNGANFQAGTAIRWNGRARTTTVVSPSRMTTIIPGALVPDPGTASVTAYTAASCGGGVSNALTVTITGG